MPYLGFQSKVIKQQLKSCIYKFYGCFDLKIIFRNTRRIKSFFPYKDRLNRSLMSKVVYKASCWDCDDFYIGKTKRRLHDRKTEHFKALAKSCHTSAIADHITSTGHNIKWDHFDILATGRSDLHCKIKETLLIRELQPALNENVGSEKLFLYLLGFVCFADFILKSVCLYFIFLIRYQSFTLRLYLFAFSPPTVTSEDVC